MKPKFVAEKKVYAELYETLTKIRDLTADAQNLRDARYITEAPVDDMNWGSWFSVMAYLRLNKRNSSPGWCVYFELYDDRNRNLEHFLKTYETSAFCDCSYVFDTAEFYEIDDLQKEKFGEQWSILGAEDHVVFSKDLSWFLVTDCTVDKSKLYFRSKDADIIDIWKQEFLFEMKNA